MVYVSYKKNKELQFPAEKDTRADILSTKFYKVVEPSTFD